MAKSPSKAAQNRMNMKVGAMASPKNKANKTVGKGKVCPTCGGTGLC